MDHHFDGIIALLHAANVENVNGVVVTGVPRELVLVVGALPRLGDGTVVERVCAVRPDAVDEAWLVILIIVENGVWETLAMTFLSKGERGAPY